MGIVDSSGSDESLVFTYISQKVCMHDGCIFIQELERLC